MGLFSDRQWSTVVVVEDDGNWIGIVLFIICIVPLVAAVVFVQSVCGWIAAHLLPFTGIYFGLIGGVSALAVWANPQKDSRWKTTANVCAAALPTTLFYLVNVLYSVPYVRIKEGNFQPAFEWAATAILTVFIILLVEGLLWGMIPWPLLRVVIAIVFMVASVMIFKASLGGSFTTSQILEVYGISPDSFSGHLCRLYYQLP